ncbi:uncharacterized protein METZ01_LOCUS466000, partial [marine metagenome]
VLAGLQCFAVSFLSELTFFLGDFMIFRRGLQYTASMGLGLKRGSNKAKDMRFFLIRFDEVGGTFYLISSLTEKAISVLKRVRKFMAT